MLNHVTLGLMLAQTIAQTGGIKTKKRPEVEALQTSYLISLST